MEEIIDINGQEIHDDRIDRYLLHQMSREEEMAFEQDLRRDASLRQRARLIASMVKAMKVSEEEGVMPAVMPGARRMVAKNPLVKSKREKK